MSAVADRLKGMVPGFRNGRATAPAAAASASRPKYSSSLVVDLTRRRDQLVARVAELQWDLGGLVYEMAIRNQHQGRGAGASARSKLQDADAELSEVERIVRMEETGDRRLLLGLRRPPQHAAPPSAGSADDPCCSRSPATRSSAAERRRSGRHTPLPSRSAR